MHKLFYCAILGSAVLPALYLLLMHTQLPPLSDDTLTNHKPLLLLCVIERTKVNAWLRAVPQTWHDEVARHADLRFVVGMVSERLETLERLEASERLLVLPVNDTEYPPIGKELHLYEALFRTRLAMRYQFFLKFDSDTIVIVPRLLSAILYNNWTSTEPLYAGSPLHHCECSVTPTGGRCSAADGIHYCGGAAVLTSSRTVKDLARRIKRCYAPTRSFASTCRSSDSWLGWCMNTLLGLRCTPARSRDPLPPHGRSYAAPDTLGRKFAERHHICQDLSSHGGIRDRHVLPNTWQFTWPDWKFCITLHAFKLCEDFRYGFYNIGYNSTDFRPCNHCFLSILLQTVPGGEAFHHEEEAFAQFASFLGVQVTRVNISDNPNLLPPCENHIRLSSGQYLRLLPFIHKLRTTGAFGEVEMPRRTEDLLVSMVVPPTACNSTTTLFQVRSPAEFKMLFKSDLSGNLCT